jgi:transcriptional regulator GlxA family with amidase domain
VFTVAKQPGTVLATGGLKVVPDFDFATAARIDLLMVPGGFGTRRLLDDAATIAWIQDAAAKARWITSVCTGALLLARAGLLAGRRATTHWASLDLLGSLDNTITVERAARYVNDGVITSAGVAAGMDMAFAVVELLHGKAVADETARYIEFQRSA